jgi:hypothetical protein
VREASVRHTFAVAILSRRMSNVTGGSYICSGELRMEVNVVLTFMNHLISNRLAILAVRHLGLVHPQQAGSQEHSKVLRQSLGSIAKPND